MMTRTILSLCMIISIAAIAFGLAAENFWTVGPALLANVLCILAMRREGMLP